MKITFHQTPADLSDLWKNSLRQRKGLIAILLFFVLVSLLNITLQVLKEGISLSSLLSWVIPILLVLGIWYLIMKSMLKRQANKENGELITGYREVSFLETGILYKTNVSETTFSWNAVTKLSESAKNYFLYMGKQRAIIIPKGAFETNEQLKSFLNLIKQYADEEIYIKYYKIKHK